MSYLQNALHAAGIQASRIESLWWLNFWPLTAAYVLTIAVILTAVLRRRAPEPSATEAERTAREARLGRNVLLATSASIAVLVVLFAGDLHARSELRTLESPNALHIKVTGHQWWWEFQYDDPHPSHLVTTANEIHIPVGRPVTFELLAADVIHSFWVPNLHGKKDLIPGHRAFTTLRADRPGVYMGQCAEFCGMEHATMRFQVVAEPDAAFDRWILAQRQPAPPPVTDSQKRGQQVFMGSSCVMCHTIQGTQAGAKLGPDLTHVASRLRIASGTLTNVPQHLRRWLLDPQGVRPGVLMPASTLPAADLNALLDYLESLK